MRMQSEVKYVTEATFNKFVEGPFNKLSGNFTVLDSSFKRFTEVTFKETVNRLDAKIDRIALSLVNTQFDVAYLKENMATKQDVNTIMNTIVNKIDSFIGKGKELDQEQLVQGLHIKELRETSKQHEQRITALEVPRSN